MQNLKKKIIYQIQNMDDPLKPKAVPLSAETVLWFEFLLDPELITKHLQKPAPGKFWES